MADPQQLLSFDQKVFVILAQIFGAFVHGADGLYVDDDVFLEATRQYGEQIRRDLEHWPQDGVQVLYVSRAMGRLAAHLALEDDRFTIMLPDYLRARKAVHEGRLFHAFCPFLERGLDLPH